MTTPSAIAPRHTNATGWHWAPVFVLSYVALWPAPGYAEGILVLGALAAITHLVLAPRHNGAKFLSTSAWALTSVLFVTWWLPQTLSAIDAVDTRRALTEALTDLRYLPFLWLAAAAVTHPRGRRLTLGGLAVIVLIWTLDALTGAITGSVSPLFWGLDQLKQLISGRAMCPADIDLARASGIFGPCNIKLGVILASLSPFLLYTAARRFRGRGWCITATLLGIVIVLSGMRAAWLTFALVTVLSSWQLFGWKKALAGLVAAVVVFAVLAFKVPHVGQRLANTAQVIQSPSSVDTALSGRVRIWSAAICMFKQHPINGVGTRSFREAFAGCDPTPEEPALWGSGPAFHAHQIVLEIASETGTLGLFMWLTGIALAWRAWRFAPLHARDEARPAMLALAVTVFPLNTHLAFYSTLWGGLTLMLAALYTGSLFGCVEQDATPAPPR